MVRKNKSPPLAYKASDGVMLLSRYWNKLVAGLVKSVKRLFLRCAKIAKLDLFPARTSCTRIVTSQVVFDDILFGLLKLLIKMFIEHGNDL